MIKTIEDWVEKNHIPTVNVEGYLMVSKEDLTKLLVKYKTEQLIIDGVVVPKGTLICESCGVEFKPVDKWNFHCQTCQPCNPLTN